MTLEARVVSDKTASSLALAVTNLDGVIGCLLQWTDTAGMTRLFARMPSPYTDLQWPCTKEKRGAIDSARGLWYTG
jgi:hypothetical protein